MTVDDLISLRSQVISGFVDGGIAEEEYRADLDALAVGLDRLLTPDGRGTLQQRAAKVVAEILADSQARLVAEPPARLARIEFGSRRYRERLSREDPDRYEAERREEEALEALEPDEVRMARPIVAALRRRTSAQDRRDRLAAMVRRPRVVEPVGVRNPGSITWRVRGTRGSGRRADHLGGHLEGSQPSGPRLSPEVSQGREHDGAARGCNARHTSGASDRDAADPGSASNRCTRPGRSR
jgi:hypothetical protein